MRIVNGFIELALLALFVLLIGGVMHGQTQGNAADAIDAIYDATPGQAGPAGKIVYPESVAIGDELVACIYSDTSAGGSGYAIADSLGNTWTKTTPVTTPGATNITQVYMAYTHSAFAGADTITTGPFAIFGGMSMTRLAHVSGVIDGSVATTTLSGSTSVQTITTSNTTTVNGDLLVSCLAAGGINDRFTTPGDTEYLSNEGADFNRALITQKHTGALGTNTATNNVWGNGATFAMATLAFKPTTIALVDTAYPEASAGTAYSMQLHGVGGIAGLTYACTVLPSNGLSLNTATGVISGSTPTVGTISPSCTVTDGTSTSAANVLPIKIGGGFNTPTIRSSLAADFNIITSVTLSGVACGDIITLTVTGDDTHNGNGWLQAINGVSNNVNDTFLSPVARVLTHGGTFSSPLVTYIVGPVTQSGTDTINVPNNQGSSSGNEVLAIDWSGAQGVVDVGTIGTNMYTSAGGTLSTSFTTVVPNELLIATSMNGGLRGGLTTYTIGAPFGVVNLSGDLLVADATIAAAGSTTGAVTFTSANGVDSISNSLFALRPALPSANCSVFNGAGEKIRRQVW